MTKHMHKGRVVRTIAIGGLVFVAAVLFVIPWACTDPDVPSWERCVSYFNTPAWSVEDLGLDASLDAVIPFLLGGVAGVATWFLSSRREDQRGGD